MTQAIIDFQRFQQGTVVFVSEDDLWSVPVEGWVRRFG